MYSFMVKSEDQNTSFLNILASGRRQRNCVPSHTIINRMQVEDMWRIKFELVDFFLKLYSKEEFRRPNFYGVAYDSIHLEWRSWLKCLFNKEEILDVVFSLNRGQSTLT